MQIQGIRVRRLLPPKDSLTDALVASRLTVREGDIIAISSKVVGIDEGQTVPVTGTSKDVLVKSEADWFLEAPRSSRWRRNFTIRHGAFASSAGIDESNGNGFYVLYPRDPFKSAARLRAWIQKRYGVKKVGVLITDSTSVPLRRGAIGFALSWDGIEPLRDYRGTTDIFGRAFRAEVANHIDALAAAAVLTMGEGAEQRPVARIRGIGGVVLSESKSKETLVAIENDLFAPLLFHKALRWVRRKP